MNQTQKDRLRLTTLRKCITRAANVDALRCWRGEPELSRFVGLWQARNRRTRVLLARKGEGAPEGRGGRQGGQTVPNAAKRPPQYTCASCGLGLAMRAGGVPVLGTRCIDCVRS